MIMIWFKYSVTITYSNYSNTFSITITLSKIKAIYTSFRTIKLFDIVVVI